MLFAIISMGIQAAAAHAAMAKLQKESALAGASMAALGGTMAAVAGIAGLGLGMRPPKPKPPGPKDWSPRRHGSCLCPNHSV